MQCIPNLSSQGSGMGWGATSDVHVSRDAGRGARALGRLGVLRVQRSCEQSRRFEKGFWEGGIYALV